MTKPEEDKPLCGIVMPISKTDGCDESHWADVLGIVKTAIGKAGYEPNMVSAANDVGVIQKRIVQNLYENPIVVVDISGRNANVMFELGMRLAFDKPTIVLKDNETPYSFDTSPLEHIPYPRDLRFGEISKFQDRLVEKIKSAAKSNGDQSFLKSFGDFKVAEIDVSKSPVDEIILDEIQELKIQLRSVASKVDSSRKVRSPARKPSSKLITEKFEIPSSAVNSNDMYKLANSLEEIDGVVDSSIVTGLDGGSLDLAILKNSRENSEEFFSYVRDKINDIFPF